MTEAKK